jgi:adenine-specific DNA-methyltransferase
MPKFQDQFIFNQLIPYIGNKRKLLPLLQAALERTGAPGKGRFLDLMAGSTVVSRMAKQLGYQVLCNDWEPYSRTIASCYIAQNHPPAFTQLGGLNNALSMLNSLQPVHGYIAHHYCPEDDENADPDTERMFYTQENGRRIDAIRGQIEEWKNEGIINANEEAALLAPLIFQSAYCSNTSGVFKGFHHGWGGRTSTALYRIRSLLTLDPPLFFDNKYENSVYCEDAIELAGRLEAEVVYLDPPYNQHQYGSNYHLLNTVALWDKPALAKKHRLNGHSVEKAAIRKDWRTLRNSNFCSRVRSCEAWEQLISRCRARWMLVSYSTDGILPLGDLVEMLSSRGKITPAVRKYKRYRVSTQRYSHRGYNLETAFLVDCENSGSKANRKRVADFLDNAAEELEDETSYQSKLMTFGNES